jgi:hypothetical protein
MYPHFSVAIERGCSIGANHAQNRRLARSDPAHAPRSPDSAKFEHVSTSTLHELFLWQIIVRNVRNAPLPNSINDEVCLCNTGSSDLA